MLEYRLGRDGHHHPAQIRDAAQALTAIRNDFAVLCHPVISMRDPLAHADSRRNLLGDRTEDTLRTQLSIETRVDAAFPRTFLWSSADDPVVSVRNTYALANALARAGVAHELHVFPSTPHGIGLGVRDPLGKSTRALHPWARLCGEWLLTHFGKPREEGARKSPK